MSSFHIGYGNSSGGSYTLNVEFHIPVPDETLPLTGANMRALLSNDNYFVKTSEFADAAELTLITAGEIAIVKENIKVHSSLTNNQTRQVIIARYSNLSIILIDNLRLRYKGYGYQENI